jgi:signal transduction histidine kinase
LKVFDPFYTTKPVGEGTGLGLPISHGIIEKHNGKIEVSSVVDVGTCFKITLPLSPK